MKYLVVKPGSNTWIYTTVDHEDILSRKKFYDGAFHSVVFKQGIPKEFAEQCTNLLTQNTIYQLDKLNRVMKGKTSFTAMVNGLDLTVDVENPETEEVSSLVIGHIIDDPIVNCYMKVLDLKFDETSPTCIKVDTSKLTKGEVSFLELTIQNDIISLPVFNGCDTISTEYLKKSGVMDFSLLLDYRYEGSAINLLYQYEDDLIKVLSNCPTAMYYPKHS